LKLLKKIEPWRKRLHRIIYEADTPAGKAFDVMLLIIIVLSIIFVMLESVKTLNQRIHEYLIYAEWVITGLFTIEYIARIVCLKKPKRYIFSFYGLIDLISTIPLYLTLLFPAGGALLTIRALRLLRVFRILKVSRYIGEGNKLRRALNDSKAKIFVFLFAVVIICLIAGTAMYIIEGEESGFNNIPVSLYWCIVTLTTVGFGDIHPITPLGQFLAAIIMIMGYGVIAVPTGIVSAEYSKTDKSQQDDKNTKSCFNCGKEHHVNSAKFCSRCGYELNKK
jgi:voltage-gated potassium channel